MEIIKVQPNEVHIVWLKARKYIDAALQTARGEGNPEHIRRHVIDGRMDMFVAMEDGEVVACMTTQFVRHPIYTSLRINILGGEPGSLDRAAGEFFPGIKKWATEHGAEHVEALCHPAMARLLQQKHGFKKEPYITVTMDLEV